MPDVLSPDELSAPLRFANGILHVQQLNSARAIGNIKRLPPETRRIVCTIDVREISGINEFSLIAIFHELPNLAYVYLKQGTPERIIPWGDVPKNCSILIGGNIVSRPEESISLTGMAKGLGKGIMNLVRR